ncbi:MAG TPA: hypothetical protein VFC19_32950 [Candidatus Limnocylindrales bacterium]|nr:hypothetical protein [Candidatus Limnocylindrales bacterium]
MTDEFGQRYAGLATGSYDCVDRIVLNAYFSLGHNPGGFRVWWRGLHGSDDQLDDTHLMRMAGRLARRVKAWGAANGVPVVFCKAGERKHAIAEDYLAGHEITEPGVFLVLVAKAPATVWKVKRSANGAITNLEKKREYVNHYSFHLMDPDWGHVTIKMSGHPPFGAQIILNGHEWVACQGRRVGIAFSKDGNCFTAVADPVGLARIADALSQHAAVGRLGQVCDRWIYTACLCFALDLDEQRRSGFSYNYSIYQVEYSRNLLFRSGARMQQLFDRVVDRTRSRLDVPAVRTIFGARHRPHRDRSGSAAIEAVIETPRYDLTWFKLTFGRLAVKAYTKGEHVLRFEATVHNTKDLNVGRTLDRFPEIVAALGSITEQFCTAIDCVDIGFLTDGVLDELPRPSQLGAARVGGIDPNTPRMHTTLTAVLALATAPSGFTVGQLAAKVHTMTGHTDYTVRQAAYDLRKLRGKQLVDKLNRSRRYHLPPDAVRTIAALLTLRDQVIAPILAGVRSPRMGRQPKIWTAVDRHYEQIRIDMQVLLVHLGLATAATAA